MAEGDSIVTDVEEVACMTERWKRAGIEVESCVVGGRMRRAVARNVVSTTTTTYEQTMCTNQLAPRLSVATTNSRGPWSLFSSSQFLSAHSHKSARRRLPRVFLTEPLSDDLPPCSVFTSYHRPARQRLTYERHLSHSPSCTFDSVPLAVIPSHSPYLLAFFCNINHGLHAAD